MIDKFTEQKIKDSADIVDVMGDFLVLKRTGVRYTCLCPFHEDHELGSFSIYPRANVYKCFSCDAKGGPIDFLIDYKKLSYPEALIYLAKKYGIHVDEKYDKEKFKNIKPSKPREMTEATNDLPKRIWPTDTIGYFKNLDDDNLVKWLRSLKWNGCQRANLEHALIDYHVGHCHFTSGGNLHEWTIWWQLDEKNQLHNGHFMKYGTNGHRDKSSSYNQTWYHARMKYATVEPFNELKEQASYCLFGQHLLNKFPHATVNIVESEKTAIIMASAYGNSYADVWMACGGLWNLTRERLQPLIDAGRKIQLFPDKDGIDKWKEKAVELRYNNVFFNTTIVEKCWLPIDGDKADIADIVIRMLNE